MIELVFIACMIAHPDACEEKTLSFLSRGSDTRSCVLRAPPTLAAWTGEHPGYRIASWRCQDPANRVDRA